MKEIMELSDIARETGFAIHRYHRHGHLEKVYENALAHRLRKSGLDVAQQHSLKVLARMIIEEFGDINLSDEAEPNDNQMSVSRKPTGASQVKLSQVAP